jgi:inorganic pyrophosphatase/exopolyphosphatase
MIRLAEHIEINREVIKLHKILIDTVKMKRPTHTVQNDIKKDLYRNKNWLCPIGFNLVRYKD